MANLRVARALHLIDIENITGAPRPTLEEVLAARDAYRGLVQMGDHVVIACNHGAFLTVERGWPGARHIARSGQDGADLALINVIENEHPADRFTSVVLASGDGIFAGPASRLCGLDVSVTVVVGRGKLSNRLRLASQHLAYLDLSRPPAAGGRIRWAA